MRVHYEVWLLAQPFLRPLADYISLLDEGLLYGLMLMRLIFSLELKKIPICHPIACVPRRYHDMAVGTTHISRIDRG